MTNEDIANEMIGRFCERTNKTWRTVGIICLAVGIALIACAFTDSAKGGPMFYAGFLFGLGFAIYGGVKALFGSTEIYDTKSGETVKTKSVFYPAGSKGELMNALADEKWDALKKSSSGCSQPLCIKVWYTKDGSYASAQLMEFVPYQYEPVGKLKEISDGARAAFLDAVK